MKDGTLATDTLAVGRVSWRPGKHRFRHHPGRPTGVHRTSRSSIYPSDITTRRSEGGYRPITQVFHLWQVTFIGVKSSKPHRFLAIGNMAPPPNLARASRMATRAASCALASAAGRRLSGTSMPTETVGLSTASPVPCRVRLRTSRAHQNSDAAGPMHTPVDPQNSFNGLGAPNSPLPSTSRGYAARVPVAPFCPRSLGVMLEHRRSTRKRCR